MAHGPLSQAARADCSLAALSPLPRRSLAASLDRNRVKARVVSAYKKHLEETPNRAAIRKMRARATKGLRKAEQQVRHMYEAVDLKSEEDLDYAIVIGFRVPMGVDGMLELVPYSKEIGLD